MINSVQNIKSVEQNRFAEFNRKGEYYITPEIAKDIFDTSEKEKDKKGKKVGIIIAAASLLTALSVFAVTKGLPKNTYKWLEEWGQKLEENVNRRKMRGESGPVTSFYNYTLKAVRKFGAKSKSINNFTSFKDLLFMKLMSKTSATKKIHTKVTQFFENLSRKTVKRRYSSFDKKFTNLFGYYQEVNAEILARNPEYTSIIQNIEQRMQKIKTHTDNGFGKKARMTRYKRMHNAVKDLDNRVVNIGVNGMGKDKSLIQNLKLLKESQVHQSFIAEDLMSAEKISLAKDVSLLRHAITHNVGDNYQASEKLVSNIASFINPKDAQSAKLLKELKSALSSYKKFSGPYEEKYRAILNSEIIEILKSLSERISKSAENFKYSDATVEQVASYVKQIETVLGKTDKGEFQELLTLYKSILPRTEYLKLKEKTNKTIKSLDNAINTETNLFFDKLRDLSLGAAPTDMLTVLGSVFGVGAGLTKADNRDERISATLKYGIPVIGGVATSIILTVCLVSGIWAMGGALVSGCIMNRIGSKIDSHRKQLVKQMEDNKHAEAVKAEINAQKA